LRRNLGAVQRGEIVGDGLLFVEADVAGVGADESFIEDAAGKLIEVFFFEGAEHAGADFCGVGNGVEFDAALFALFTKFFPERAQVVTPAGGSASAVRPKMGLMIGERGLGRHRTMRGLRIFQAEVWVAQRFQRCDKSPPSTPRLQPSDFLGRCFFPGAVLFQASDFLGLELQIYLQAVIHRN